MKKTLLMSAFLTLMGWTYAQTLDPSVIASGGGIHATDHLSLEWTLGEMAVEAIYFEDEMITEGYHQPMLTVSDFDETTMTNTLSYPDYQITVNPNPVNSILNVKIETSTDSDVFVSLFNLLGDQQFKRLKKR